MTNSTAVPARTTPSHSTACTRFRVMTQARAAPRSSTPSTATAASFTTRDLRSRGRGCRRGRWRALLRILSVQQDRPVRPRRGLRLLVGVELVHREDEILARVAGRLLLARHHDGVDRAHLHAELAEDARVEIQREVLAPAALLARVRRLRLRSGLQEDHARRTDALAGEAPDARLVAMLVVHERERRAVALGPRAHLLGELLRRRLAEGLARGVRERPQRVREVAHQWPPATARIAAASTRMMPAGMNHRHARRMS